MTLALRITGSIFIAISGLLFHFDCTKSGIFFSSTGIVSLLMSLFCHKKEEDKKQKKEEQTNKEKILIDARKSYERKDSKKLLSFIDSLDIPEREKHEIYNTIVLEKKRPGGTAKSNPYINE